MKEVSPTVCMPSAADYTFMWWAHGWRGRSSDGRKVLAFQTGRYGMAMDVEKVELLHLGTIAHPKPYAEAVAQDNDVVFSLPKAHLEIRVVVGNTTYRCVRGATNQRDHLNFPVRIIESGRFVQRADVLQLEFEDDAGNKLNAQGRLEIVAWTDRLLFLVEVTPEQDLSNARPEIDVEDEGKMLWSMTEQQAGQVWKTGQTRMAAVSLSPGSAEPDEPAPNDTGVVRAENLKDKSAVNVTYDAVHGWYYVALPKEDWRENQDPDHLERVNVTLSNPFNRERVIRLLFAKDYGFPGVTGMTPMLRDANGNPTGIPVQISKNWHRREERRFLYEGPWFHGFTMLRLPPKATTRCEFNITYGRWGGVAAAAHAQLCLIGWGVNQLWDQAAIGSWGESICYDPDVNLNRSMIDDVRPLMVWQMNSKQTKWGWTNNVGGGDFLVYFNDKGQKQFLSRMRTAYLSQGPNLTDVVYAGVSADGNIAARIHVRSLRSDDVNRALHFFRYDVIKPTPFSRLAFYQVGADNYNDHQFERLARGNAKGLIEEWGFPKGGKKYYRTGIPCEGVAPWFSLHQAINQDKQGGAWANRGLVIRSWKARLGGKDVPHPFASCYGTENGPPSMNVELTPPPDVKMLQPGDFVEAEVELVVMPQSADDYYGPNENLRAALKEGGNTWKPIWREAVGNNLTVNVQHGKVLSRYPIVIEVYKNQTAEFEVTGGVGCVPITFVGLSRHNDYELYQQIEGKSIRVDQSVHGKDFWQTGYDAVTKKWSITYNVPLDSPGDKSRTVRLRFGKR